MQILTLSVIGTVLAIFLVLFLLKRERSKNRFSTVTEKMLRSPGYTLNKQLQNKTNKLLEPILTICFLPYLYTHLFNGVNFETKIIVAGILLIPLVVSIRKISHLFKAIRKLKLSIDAEVYTGQELNLLMQTGALVYHDIPYQNGSVGHIIVSKAGIFTVATEAVAKPLKGSNDSDVNDAKVVVKDDTLVFPHCTISEPIEQAKLNARQFREILFRKSGIKYPVFPIIALPEWSIVDVVNNKKSFLVVNPKRGAALARYLQANRIADNDLKIAFALIDEVARGAPTVTEITDPDAMKNYSFSLNRVPQ